MPGQLIRVERICEHCGIRFLVKPFRIRKGEGRFCSRPCRGKHLAIPPDVRFRRFISPPTEQGCTLWTGSRFKEGYGHFGISRGVASYAHRFAWTLVHGPIPDGLFVLHRCDNPPCVNPDHLFLGTALDNAQDMIAKGRGLRGEQLSWAKLTPSSVRLVRERIASGQSSVKELAEELGVARATVRRAAQGESWKHVT